MRSARRERRVLNAKPQSPQRHKWGVDIQPGRRLSVAAIMSTTFADEARLMRACGFLESPQSSEPLGRTRAASPRPPSKGTTFADEARLVFSHPRWAPVGASSGPHRPVHPRAKAAEGVARAIIRGESWLLPPGSHRSARATEASLKSAQRGTKGRCLDVHSSAINR